MKGLNKEDQNKVLSVCHKSRKPLKAELIMRLGLQYAMRSQEMANVRLEHITETHITITGVKNGRTGVYPIAPILPLIKEYVAKWSPKEYLFEYRGKRVSRESIGRLFKRLAKKAKIGEKRMDGSIKVPSIHSLRHSFGYNAVDANLNPIGINRLMRHRSMSATMEYIHTSQSKFEEYFESVT